MSRTVTQLVALGVLPLGLAIVVYLTAQRASFVAALRGEALGSGGCASAHRDRQ